MLATRMKDHLNLRNPLTAVGEHCAHEHYNITKESVIVLATEYIWLKRNVREAIEIKIGQPAMNRDHGYELLRQTCAVIMFGYFRDPECWDLENKESHMVVIIRCV